MSTEQILQYNHSLWTVERSYLPTGIYTRLPRGAVATQNQLFNVGNSSVNSRVIGQNIGQYLEDIMELSERWQTVGEQSVKYVLP